MISQERYEEAVVRYRELLNEHPQDRNLRVGLARVLSWMGEFDQAIVEFEDLQQAFPEDREVQLALARLYSWSERYEASAGQYRVLLEETADDRQLRLELAKVLSWSGRYDEAIQQYNRLLIDDPTDGTSLLESARIQSWTGDFRRSLQKYRQLLRREPTRDLKVETARVYAWAGRLIESERLYQEVLSDDPADREALMGLAELSYWQEKDQRAKVLYEKAMAQQDDSTVHVGLGRIYHRWELWSRADGEFRAALELDPENEEAAKGLKALARGRGPEAQFRHGRYHDSNSFKRWTYGLDVRYGGWKDIGLHAGVLRTEYDDAQDQELTRDTFSLKGSLRLGEQWHAWAGYSLHRYEGRSASSYFARLRRLWDDGWLEGSFSRYPVIDVLDNFEYNFFSTLATIESILLGISTRELRGEGGYRFLDRFLWTTGVAYGWYNDDNDVLTANSRLTYRVSGEPYLAAYYNFFWTDHDRPSPFYWSPSSYSAHGLGVMFAYDADPYFFGFDETIFYQPDAPSWGNAFVITAGYSWTDHFRSSITLFFFDSDITDISFHAFNALLALNYLF